MTIKSAIIDLIHKYSDGGNRPVLMVVWEDRDVRDVIEKKYPRDDYEISDDTLDYFTDHLIKEHDYDIGLNSSVILDKFEEFIVGT